ncbi:hypothetical protein [Demequina soli]|uniref:hypothetical protein n=1 Tax=Demequina soli TaxID=1638987 RepID=UPI0007834D05|nr:hypothetical protein [Demequina soli]
MAAVPGTATRRLSIAGELHILVVVTVVATWVAWLLVGLVLAPWLGVDAAWLPGPIGVVYSVRWILLVQVLFAMANGLAQAFSRSDVRWSLAIPVALCVVVGAVTAMVALVAGAVEGLLSFVGLGIVVTAYAAGARWVSRTPPPRAVGVAAGGLVWTVALGTVAWGAWALAQIAG